ncbi:helix-turn-helix domain-containing protein [Arthrobacter sp. SDTb3-6]|uniref:helix-turn-helix domain-containing protein n=1 Tax=Arthrobacter sp. SDTb3-6 TaxID=2713571 RepID=UPI00159D8162|nr:helix-turn-helix transcriptional regulator [Arthrobacter sp. SDTb3-6]NVM97682.1 helix-turn-helix transcriptional regulator [Arthrobacter sp. SDTb3-6]
MVDDVEREHLLQGVAARLVWLRARAGYSQEDAAALAGLSRTGLGKLEHGRSRPTKDSLRDLASVYAPDHPQVEYWNLCKLAGTSLRDSHRRLSPAHKPATVRTATDNLKAVLKTMERLRVKAGPDLTKFDAGAAKAIAAAEQAVRIAQAREDLLQRLRENPENGPDSGENVG